MSDDSTDPTGTDSTGTDPTAGTNPTGTDPTAGTSGPGLTNPGDTIQDAPIMSGSDEATDDEKSAGRDKQSRADEEFYQVKDTEAAKQVDPDSSTSPYVNPSHSDLSHADD